MGYYLSMGWQKESSLLDYEGLFSYIERQSWSTIIHDPDYEYPITLFSFDTPDSKGYSKEGMMDIIKKQPSDGSLLAPWISIRLSWASDEKEFLGILDFLLKLGEELDMVLLDEHNNPITWSNLNLIVERFFKLSGTVINLVGSVRKKE